jgi:hypothetical protein
MLDPDGIDDAIVTRVAIDDFKDLDYRRLRDRRGVPFDVWSLRRRVRTIFEYAAAKANEGPVVTRSFSLE